MSTRIPGLLTDELFAKLLFCDDVEGLQKEARRLLSLYFTRSNRFNVDDLQAVVDAAPVTRERQVYSRFLDEFSYISLFERLESRISNMEAKSSRPSRTKKETRSPVKKRIAPKPMKKIIPRDVEAALQAAGEHEQQLHWPDITKESCPKCGKKNTIAWGTHNLYSNCPGCGQRSPSVGSMCGKCLSVYKNTRKKCVTAGCPHISSHRLERK